jgi:hypothetical protein
MTDTTANLGLPVIAAAQAQKHVTHNEALRLLDTLVQLAVLDRDLSAPPGSPNDGERWIVGPSPTGAWAGHAGDIAAWQDDAWQFAVPKKGWIAHIEDENARLAWDGSQWMPIGGEPPFPGTGTNDDAPAGYIGEYVKSSVASGSAVALTSNSVASITSISLSAGDWDVRGVVGFQGSGSPSVTRLTASVMKTDIASVSEYDDDTQSRAQYGYPGAAITLGSGNAGVGLPLVPGRISLATTTTIYLKALPNFTGGTSVSAYGFIAARRVR